MKHAQKMEIVEWLNVMLMAFVSVSELHHVSEASRFIDAKERIHIILSRERDLDDEWDFYIPEFYYQ